MLKVIYAINLLFQILITLIFLEAVMSWFVRPGSSIYQAYLTLQHITEPIVGPCRRVTGRLAYRIGIDISPWVAVLVLMMIQRLLMGLLSAVAAFF